MFSGIQRNILAVIASLYITGCNTGLIDKSNNTQKAEQLKTILISEISNQSKRTPDWIELYNPNNSVVDLSGYIVRDNSDKHSYVIPSGTMLQASQYLVISQDKKGKVGFSFNLGSKDSVRLYTPNNSLIDSTSWMINQIPVNGSWARYPSINSQFIAINLATKGAQNSRKQEHNRLAHIRNKYPHYIYNPEHSSDEIFNQKKLQRYDLYLDDSSLEYLNSDPAAESYVEGALLHNGKLLSAVGIRYKGSLGTFKGCVSGKNPAQPSGEKTCDKLSMKVKVNWKNKNNLFYGLTKLQFHSQNNDPSMMHERLGYWLFNKFGVQAPRSVHAKLYINGKYNGLFALTEQIDNQFLRHNFTNHNGNLYKSVWPVDSKGRSTDTSLISSSLKNNNNKANIDNFIAFSKAVEKFDQDKVQVDKAMNSWFDIDTLMRTLVVDRAIAADDGIFHWYCYNTCFNHNFYFYQESKNNKIQLIPWDLDMAFENLGEPKNPYTHIEDKWNVIRNECKPYEFGIYSRRQRSAACDKLIQAFTIYENQFNQLKNQFEKKLFNSDNIEHLIMQWSQQLEASVIEASKVSNNPKLVRNWQQAVIKLKNDINNNLKNKASH